jgi:plastocyanin
MKHKCLCATLLVLLGVFYCAQYSPAAEEEQTEQLKIVNKIIIINEYEEVRPLTLTTKTGTTVIWVNHSRTPVEILFLDKKVTVACGSPVNFFVGKGGAYESGKIPFGSTASLCFLEKGTYEYMIKSSRTFYMKQIERDAKGKIMIE